MANDQGFDPKDLDAGADAALDALDSAGPRGEALIAAWVERRNAPAVHSVAEHGNGKPRKAARRALGVLRSRGVAIPERARVTRLAAPDEVRWEAWLLAPDGAGNALFVIGSRSRASRYRCVFVVSSDAVGVLEVSLAELSQAQLKERLQRALPGADYRAVRVPVDWARARVATARKRHAELGSIEPLGFKAAESLLSPVPSGNVEHPFDAEGLDLALDDAREVATKSAALHAVPEFRGWIAPRPAVDELLQKVGAAMAPGEQPEAEAFGKLLDEQVVAATDRFFTPQRRSELLVAMKDSALSVLEREGEARALEVVAVMKAIDSAGLITDPPSEIPFLRGFFDKAVALLAAQGGGRIRVPVRRAPGEPAAATEPTPEPAPATEGGAATDSESNP
jgi:hypothetical protein